MVDASAVNADMLAFWNGVGGDIWVARQAHTDVTLKPVSDALLRHGAPQAGERVLDVGCGCGASTLDMALAVGESGSVQALDISGPMLEEAARRATASGLTNVAFRKADAATSPIEPYDLLTSMFGLMFFGDPLAAFSHLREAAAPGARMSFVAWRSLADNPWIGVPMDAVIPHLPPRPKGTPNAPGMFAFADPGYVTELLASAGWTDTTVDAFDCSIDIAAGKGVEEAVIQSTQIGAVNSWLRNQPEDIVTASVDSIRSALAPYADGESVNLPAGMWLISASA